MTIPPETPHGQWLVRGAVASSVAAVLVATLYPAYGMAADVSPWCLTCDETWLSDFLANIVLFLPLGAALGLTGRKAGKALLIGALLSIGVELVQNFVPARTPALRDVLSNGLGAGLGALVVQLAPVWIAPVRSRRLALGTAALASAVGFILLGGWLQEPSFTGEALYADWRPTQPGRPGPYRGRPVSVRVANRAVRDGAEISPAILAHSGAAASSVSLRIHWRGAPWGRRSLFALMNRSEAVREAFDIRDSDLIYIVHSRGARAGLHATEAWLPHVVRLDGDVDRLSLTFIRRADRICVISGAVSDCEPIVRVGRGWTLIQDRDPIPGPALPLADGLWLAALFLPVGFWFRRLLVPGSAIALALLTLPPVLAMAAASPWEITAALIGVASGRALQPALARLVARRSTGRASGPSSTAGRFSASTRRERAIRR